MSNLMNMMTMSSSSKPNQQDRRRQRQEISGDHDSASKRLNLTTPNNSANAKQQQQRKNKDNDDDDDYNDDGLDGDGENESSSDDEEEQPKKAKKANKPKPKAKGKQGRPSKSTTTALTTSTQKLRNSDQLALQHQQDDDDEDDMDAIASPSPRRPRSEQSANIIYIEGEDAIERFNNNYKSKCVIQEIMAQNLKSIAAVASRAKKTAYLRVCKWCFKLWSSSTKTFTNWTAKNGGASHSQNCPYKNEMSSSNFVDAASFTTTGIQAIIASGVSVNQFSKICRVFESSIHAFKQIGGVINALYREANTRDPNSAMWKEVLEFETHVRQLLQNQKHLTICVDGGSENGVHLIVTTVCCEEKLIVLRPFVCEKAPSAKTIATAVKETLKIYGKVLSDVGFIVADACATNKAAFAQLQQDLPERAVDAAQVVVRDNLFPIENEDAIGEVDDTETSNDAFNGNQPIRSSLVKFRFRDDPMSANEPIYGGATFQPVACLAHYFSNVFSWTFGEVDSNSKTEKPLGVLFEARSHFNNALKSDLAAASRQSYMLHIKNSRQSAAGTVEQVNEAAAKVQITLDNLKLRDGFELECLIDSLIDHRVVLGLPETSDAIRELVCGERREASEELIDDREANEMKSKTTNLLNRAIQIAREDQKSKQKFQSSGKFGSQTRYADAILDSVEHLYFNLRAIMSFVDDVVSKKKGTTPQSWKSFVHLLAYNPKTFLTQCDIYFVSTRILGAALRKFSDHSKHQSLHAYEVLKNVCEGYKLLYENINNIYGTMFDTPEEDENSYDDASVSTTASATSAAHANAVAMKNNNKADDSDEKTKEELKSFMRKPPPSTYDDDDEDENDEENDLEETLALDSTPVNSNDAEYQKVMKGIFEFKVGDELVFQKDKKRFTRLFKSKKALGNLLQVVKAFHDNLGQDRWKRYQPRIDYQNRSLWFMIHLLSPSVLAPRISHAAMTTNAIDRMVEEPIKWFNQVREFNMKKVKDELQELITAPTIPGGKKLSDWRNELLKGSYAAMWNRAEMKVYSNLRAFALSIVCVAPVVTSVDSFFSVVGAIAGTRRVVRGGDPLNPILMQAYLHANGDWRCKSVYLPEFFTDTRTVDERRKARPDPPTGPTDGATGSARKNEDKEDDALQEDDDE